MNVNFNDLGTVYIKNGHILQHQKSPTIQSFNRIATKVETVFNYAGCCPFIGAISGVLRAAIGKIQAIVGLTLMATAVIGSACTSSRTVKERYAKIYQLGKENAIHGALNVFRGWAEAVTCGLFFGFGNLIFLVPNLNQDEPFTPHFKYGTYAR